eukprot:6063584-Amphidinium_carterae.1
MDTVVSQDVSQEVQVTGSVPQAIAEVTPPPPIPSDHDRTPSLAPSRDRDNSLRYMCPLCDWKFHSPIRRYLHLGLQHSVIMPKLGGLSQDNPNP